MKGMEENEARFPNKVLQIKHAVSEGNLVMVHSRLQLKADLPEMAVVHIFRFQDDGKIVEMWDVGQQEPEEILNENGMF